MPEWLEQIEPYTSYRYFIGLVLSGITVYLGINAWLSIRSMTGLLHDLDAQAASSRLFDEVREVLEPGVDLSALPPTRARPGRIIRLIVMSAALRVFGFRSLIRLAPELMACTLLAAACLVAYYYVFTWA